MTAQGRQQSVNHQPFSKLYRLADFGQERTCKNKINSLFTTEAQRTQRKAFLLFFLVGRDKALLFPAFLQGSACNVPYAGLRFYGNIMVFLCVLCASVVNRF
jgi:hypothetical protein